MLVVREQLERERICSRDVVRITGQRNPAERTLPFTEQGPNVFGNESWDVERVLQPGVECDGSNVVSVVKRDCATLLHLQHRGYMLHCRLSRASDVIGGGLLAHCHSGVERNSG